MKLKLRFPEHLVPEWAERYSYGGGDGEPLRRAPAIRRRGWMTRPEFLAFTRWKTARTQARCARNEAGFIRNVTTTALAARDERLKIEVLTLLDGVSWPTASVILHFCSEKPYPILDYRALWSLSCDVPEDGYDFPFWWQYCLFTRALARRLGVTMRDLDRALWQYSKENQP